MQVEEKDISLDELKSADEIFFTGTAAEVTPVVQIEDDKINTGEVGQITKNLRDEFFRRIRG